MFLKIFTMIFLLVIIVNLSGSSNEKPNVSASDGDLIEESPPSYTGYYMGHTGNISYPRDWYNDVEEVSIKPMITVLTHGLGAGPSSWSNNFGTTTSDDFAYDEDSLIERIRSGVGDANVFWAEMNGHFTFKLSRLDTRSTPLDKYSINSLVKVKHLTKDDLNKHIIIVFDENTLSSDNASSYSSLSNLLNRLALDVAYLNNNIYPKMDLIGHSRGGIINMMYAMDYPKLIDNLISIGTPYFGSDFGKIKLFAYQMGFKNNPGFNDILSNNPVFENGNQVILQEKWNNNYQAKYSRINAYAIAGDSTLEFYEQLNQDGALAHYSNLIDHLGNADNGTLVWKSTKNAIASTIRAYERELGFDTNEITPISVIVDCLNTITINPIRMNGDLFVGVNSQHGKSATLGNFIGFSYYTRYYQNINDSHLDTSKVSTLSPPIVHNLEARDAKIIDYILSKILYNTVDIQNTTILKGFKYNVTGDYTVPSIINGKTVITIGSNSFKNAGNITSVTLPNTVTTLDSDAFSGCSNLLSINLPNSISTIGSGAFAGCSSLTSITIPNSVTSIGSNTFSGCTNLTSVKLSNNTTTIGMHVFANCSNLKNITIPNSVTSVGSLLFKNCTSLENVKLSENLTTLSTSMFLNCTSLSSITIPNKVTSISANAFTGCTSLSNITLSNRLTTIGTYAFYSCTSLLSITLPDTLVNIETSAFRNCTSLENVLFVNSEICIGDFAFANCTSLTNITVPFTAISVGFGAFLGCDNLVSLSIPFTGKEKYNRTNNNYFAYIFGSTFWNDNHSNYIPESLAAVTITGTNDIPSYAFWSCRNLSSIIITGSLKTIGEGAFANCSGLVSVVLPNSLTSIDAGVFGNCTNLMNINLPDTLTTISPSAFEGCASLDNITIPTSVTSIGDYAFHNCANITEVTIPNSVTSIGNYAFQNCTNLIEVTIPDSVTSIGNYAFSNCSNLTIYCEISSSGSGWAVNWNVSECPVVWNYTGVFGPGSYVLFHGGSFDSTIYYNQTNIPSFELGDIIIIENEFFTFEITVSYIQSGNNFEKFICLFYVKYLVGDSLTVGAYYARYQAVFTIYENRIEVSESYVYEGIVAEGGLSENYISVVFPSIQKITLIRGEVS